MRTPCLAREHLVSFQGEAPFHIAFVAVSQMAMEGVLLGNFPSVVVLQADRFLRVKQSQALCPRLLVPRAADLC